MRTSFRVLPCLVLLALGGCAGNPFKDFYNDAPDANAVIERRAAAATSTVELFQHGADIQSDARSMRERGYLMLGYSQFNGASVDTELAIHQARAIGAEVVLVSGVYRNTVSGSMPLTLPAPSQTVTTQHTGTVNTYGSGGTTYGSYSGSSTATISGGTRTTYIPYSVDRFDYLASYWVKVKPALFGAFFDDLSTEQRRQHERNRGAVIDLVVNDSPAFHADVLPGDIVTDFDGVTVTDARHLLTLIDGAAGREVLVSVSRSSGPRSLKVRLRPQ